eukprot:364944-Chlamydomonas_euryale.AAC.3
MARHARTVPEGQCIAGIFMLKWAFQPNTCSRGHDVAVVVQHVPCGVAQAWAVHVAKCHATRHSALLCEVVCWRGMACLGM